MRKHSFPKPVALFVVLYMTAAISAAITKGNSEFILYILVQLFIMGVIYTIHRRIGFSKMILWGFAVWGLLHMAGGLVSIPQTWFYDGPHAVLYSLWLIPEKLKYDHLVHAYGFGLTTWLCWEALCAGIQYRLGRKLYPTLGLITLCMAAGMGFGALNEVFEFMATLMFSETNVGGYLNTGWDLVSNLIGCLVAGFLIYLRG